MLVREIMTSNPGCCSPETSLQEVAQVMVDRNCGEVPVIDNQGRPIGVITDRDIACRAVAKGMHPDVPVREIMSSKVFTVTPDMNVADCCKTLEENQIRRAPVVDDEGSCCGMVSQADIALHAAEHQVARVVREVSQPASKKCC